MKTGEVISSSWKILFKRYGITLLTLLAWLAITIVLGLLSMIPIIGSIAVCVISIPLQFGFTKRFVALYNGEDVKAFDFLNFGFKKFGMVWRVIGRMVVKYLIPIILMIGASLCISIGVSAGMFGRSSTTEILSIMGLVLFGVSFVWCFILSLKYMFVYNELAHNENAKTGKEILEATAKNMEGNVGKLLLLDLILFLISITVFVAFAVFVECMSMQFQFWGAVLLFSISGAVLLLLIYVPFIKYVTVAFYEHARKEKMPEYEVTENIDINGGNGTEGPIQNI